MIGVSRIEIRESTDQFKHLMHLQPSASAKEPLQVLYLLKSLQAKAMSTAAQLMFSTIAFANQRSISAIL